jgi:large subunit ribosomal protein L35
MRSLAMTVPPFSPTLRDLPVPILWYTERRCRAHSALAPPTLVRKKTASGKFKRGQSKMRHILTSKATKTKRKLGGGALISVADTPKVARMLPYA